MLPGKRHDLSRSLSAVADIEGWFNLSQYGFEGGILWIDFNVICRCLDREAIA
jgi:hypothetical protein